MPKKKAAYTETARTSHTKSHESTASTRSTTAKRTHAKAHQVVKDVMTPHVVAVTSVTFLPEAAQIMKEEDVGALPVVEESGKLLGIITDRDITVRAVAEGMDVLHTQVGNCFTAEELVTATPEMGIEQAEKLMESHQVRRLPVLGQENKLIGMIAMADIARAVGKEESAMVLKKVSKPGGEHSQKREA